MSNVFLTGASGRLGSVIAETLKARGDEFVVRDVNYLIFAHRYRGEPDFEPEMWANVEWVHGVIEGATWADGDRAIVLVSSINATEPAMNQSLAYNLSKAALNNMARYYAKKGPVRINTVSPDTFTTPDAKVTAQEVANVIAFLCSDRASGINGADIEVRG